MDRRTEAETPLKISRAPHSSPHDRVNSILMFADWGRSRRELIPVGIFGAREEGGRDENRSHVARRSLGNGGNRGELWRRQHGYDGDAVRAGNARAEGESVRG